MYISLVQLHKLLLYHLGLSVTGSYLGERGHVKGERQGECYQKVCV